MSNSLLLVAHGSRRESSNDEVRHVAMQLQQQLNKPDIEVYCAFLELASPSIAEGLKHCIETGTQQVTVLPYFLSAGRHVSTDIPAIIKEVQALYPDVDIQIIPHLGAATAIPEVLAQLTIKRINASLSSTQKPENIC
ncbi:sirohydrochlorin chelatase [Candidatus Venteria ishoeyi]|uniref:Sirohydrochlorin cobaltochelatase n=1 Tax=Candidatus Venteria ishoeyi TaxID=1899563 RepID=A0A1H6FGM7_9GAMM|nr:CbiX/SirB N-terminal domain-containing protein [Candidatus Venteria ishoeyi]MDM8546694.1 CbiX/SirB N-terminal domain-containing protein [Candidatus Venteria ishoeyi]SEH08581.1 Sirohydrochlorin cobaltochelatase [Candidatus Venteria ishoeyi]